MRTRKTIKINATSEVQRLARTATEIQDACNGVAVANFLLEVQKHFLGHYGTDM